MDLTECSLCNEQYNEGKRRARNLICGHFYCQDCLSQIIKSPTRRCPSCRADISASSAELLPPNFLMDDLLNKLKSGSHSISNDVEDDDFTAGDCPKHKKCQLYFTCKVHKMKICRDCTVIDHPPSQCQIISFEDEMKETKNSTITNLKTQKSRREKDTKDLQDIITDKEKTIKEKQEDIDKLQKKINEDKQIVEMANAGIQDCKENQNKIVSIHQELVSSKRINHINQFCQKAENIINTSLSLGISLEKMFKLSRFQDLIDQNPVEIVNMVLKGQATFHACADVNGEKRYAQLIVKNGDIHLPALASCSSHPALNETVNVSSLLTHYTNTDIYLTLASGGKELGMIYVKLLDNELAKYIRKLCMGTIGPSYRGAILDDKGKAWLATKMDIGGYDKSVCSEPVPAWRKTVPDKKGLVYITRGTCLGFSTSALVNSNPRAVGEVKTGMTVLEDSWTYPSGNVCIKDVGIVLK